MTLQRKSAGKDGVFSELLKEDLSFFCVVGTHAYVQPDLSFLPKIPRGVYPCIRGTHCLHDNIPFETFEIVGIEGHTGLLFHPGNFPQKDSDGCELTGEFIGHCLNGDRMVTNSKVTFEKFLALQNGVNQFILTVE